MIVEGLCTTRNLDGTINIAPLGPVVDAAQTTFLLRPWEGSTTLANLLRTRACVFHITDDVELIARAAVGNVLPLPTTTPARSVDGAILADCCRWYELTVTSVDSSTRRHEVRTQVKHVGRVRDFWGFNRARHAVLEAAILATRLHLLGNDEVLRQFEALRTPVEKTGGEAEIRAFAFLLQHIRAVSGRIN